MDSGMLGEKDFEDKISLRFDVIKHPPQKLSSLQGNNTFATKNFVANNYIFDTIRAMR